MLQVTALIVFTDMQHMPFVLFAMQLFITLVGASVTAAAMAPGIHLDFTRGPIRDVAGRWRSLPVNVGVFTVPSTLTAVRPLIVAVSIMTVCRCTQVLKCLIDLGNAFQRLNGGRCRIAS
jgi:hypothetical protein